MLREFCILVDWVKTFCCRLHVICNDEIDNTLHYLLSTETLTSFIFDEFYGKPVPLIIII